MFLLHLFLIHQVVINEVMANPKGRTGRGFPEDRNEFIEIYNNSEDTFNLLGWRISDFDARDTIVAWRCTLILLRYPTLKINTTLLPPKRYALILDQEYTTQGNGEYVMPYNLPESLTVFTVGNTTIGDGLAQNDSLILYSPDSSIISSFSFPRETKDGFSLERTAPEALDLAPNWVECLEEEGATPGYENSTLTYYDPKISNLRAVMEEKALISVSLTNSYYATGGSWQLEFKMEGKEIRRFEGESLKPRSETSVAFFLESPPIGRKEITAKLYSAGDRDTTNNFLLTYLVNLKEGEVLLVPEVFSPDNDGKDDLLSIQISLEEGSDLTVDVYDMNGRKVKRVYKGKFERDTQLFWDGRDERGGGLQRGIYILAIEYKKDGQRRFIKRSCVLAGRSQRE